MANLIESLGYSLGKVHTGMIAYLCDLGREGNMDPITAFLQALSVDVPKRPRPYREWHSVDLAIFDEDQPDSDQPRILIEMKVDDHENEAQPQTGRYAKQFPGCDAYLFVTLGAGEYFRKPGDTRFTWVRLRPFADAVDHIRTDYKAINDWAEALHHEISRRENVRRNDRSAIAQYRSRTWNIYFLGLLEESFEQRYPLIRDRIDPRCYVVGAKPDTILNFGECIERPCYFEINDDGRLHLKIYLGERSDAEKLEAIATLRQKINTAYAGIPVALNERGGFGKSKTIASFDIGLRSSNGALEFSGTEEEALSCLYRIIQPAYAANALSV